MRLDEEKLEALRSWGERLRQTSNEESVAVGRAILMLVDEIDRLHIDLWNARLHQDESVASQTAGDNQDEQVGSTLHRRLRRALGRRSDARVTETAETAEAAGSLEADHAKAWIDSLRKQE
jgi:hypothetical protein